MRQWSVNSAGWHTTILKLHESMTPWLHDSPLNHINSGGEPANGATCWNVLHAYLSICKEGLHVAPFILVVIISLLVYTNLLSFAWKPKQCQILMITSSRASNLLSHVADVCVVTRRWTPFIMSFIVWQIDSAWNGKMHNLRAVDSFLGNNSGWTVLVCYSLTICSTYYRKLCYVCRSQLSCASATATQTIGLQWSHRNWKHGTEYDSGWFAPPGRKIHKFEIFLTSVNKFGYVRHVHMCCVAIWYRLKKWTADSRREHASCGKSDGASKVSRHAAMLGSLLTQHRAHSPPRPDTAPTPHLHSTTLLHSLVQTTM